MSQPVFCPRCQANVRIVAVYQGTQQLGCCERCRQPLMVLPPVSQPQPGTGGLPASAIQAARPGTGSAPAQEVSEPHRRRGKKRRKQQSGGGVKVAVILIGSLAAVVLLGVLIFVVVMAAQQGEGGGGGPFTPFTAQQPIKIDAYVNWKRGQGIQFPGNDMGNIPTGDQTIGGVRFYINSSGSIFLGSNLMAGPTWPMQIRDIPVSAKFRTLHALHTAHYQTIPGKQIGAYQLNYADGTTAMLPILFGREVGNSWDGHPPTGANSQRSWSGQNGMGKTVHFYVTQYTNPNPDKLVNTIHFLSANSGACPCCAALSIE